MTTQPDLPIFRSATGTPNVDWMVDLLRTRGWLTASQILQEASLPATEGHKRLIRSWASAAGAQIVKGQQGFNHIANCRLEDLTHAANQSIAAGRHMIRYGIALRRHAHALIR
jgi:hypothetical protein